MDEGGGEWMEEGGGEWVEGEAGGPRHLGSIVSDPTPRRQGWRGMRGLLALMVAM